MIALSFSFSLFSFYFPSSFASFSPCRPNSQLAIGSAAWPRVLTREVQTVTEMSSPLGSELLGLGSSALAPLSGSTALEEGNRPIAYCTMAILHRCSAESHLEPEGEEGAGGQVQGEGGRDEEDVSEVDIDNERACFACLTCVFFRTHLLVHPRRLPGHHQRHSRRG